MELKTDKSEESLKETTVNCTQTRGEEEDEKARREMYGGELRIDKLNVSLNCTFGFHVMKTPAKGKHCKHV